jgi:retron-type reverse transcriptase
VKAGHLEFNTNKRRHNFVKGSKGVPQGGVLSPLLSNLMLHELDKYITQLKEERNRENKEAKPSLRNGEYGHLTYTISRTQRKLMEEKSELGLRHFDLGMKKKKRILIRKRCKVGSTVPNPNYIKMDYVRYADDWLIGLWGPR